ncbi:hypothetical protein MATR_33220 [Marivirga tractuosa]|uniref:DUF349 domain-containing protein n=1 Tax=Marivirga tractuosa (strain ATCC 23168 / DSM 4126 / NBRC 15989 / NCIMB 1408 / VKM B-1430 / H-43) TaxID=643867 RepID=E4TSB4_MARTH|nr:hypothetical protein Ftrac_2854 [Marivirga tractuosa DSM 4126]BDD16497.1 hypothetical protein MATR_33220 [Marivirga tractuosa]
MTDLQQELAFIEGGKVILREQDGFPQREIGEVKEDEATALQFFQDRFESLKEKVDKVQLQIETEDNKGSFLMKVLNLKESLSTFDGIGDFVALKERLEMLEKMLEDYISQNRKRNLEVKTTLIEEAKSYAANPDWREATEKLKELRQRWIRVGAVEEDKKEEVENTFQAIYDEFYEKKKAFHEAKKEMMAARENQYEALIDKAKKLHNDKIETEELAKKSNELVEEWKSLENIPKEKYALLLKEFKKYTQVGRKTGNSKNVKSHSKESHDKEKLTLIEELKAAQNLSPDEAIEKAKDIQQKWKNTGKTFNKSLNEEYFTLNDYIFEKGFLENLFERKAKKDLGEKEAVKFKMNILRDLISRDQRELNVFEENLEKFNLGTQKLDKMVGFKHEKQKRKLAVKQQIMDELRDLNKNLK